MICDDGGTWRTEEDILKERWAIRVATITPISISDALNVVGPFRNAGGDEALFTKIERLAIEKGHSFTYMLNLAAWALPRKPLPDLSSFSSPNAN